MLQPRPTARLCVLPLPGSGRVPISRCADLPKHASAHGSAGRGHLARGQPVAQRAAAPRTGVSPATRRSRGADRGRSRRRPATPPTAPGSGALDRWLRRGIRRKGRVRAARRMPPTASGRPGRAGTPVGGRGGITARAAADDWTPGRFRRAREHRLGSGRLVDPAGDHSYTRQPRADRSSASTRCVPRATQPFCE